MANNFVQVVPDGTGKKFQTFDNNVAGHDVHAEAVVLTNSGGTPLGTTGTALNVYLGSIAATQSGSWDIGTVTTITNPVAVTLPVNQYNIAISNVTGNGAVTAGKRYIEFILAADFTGTIGGVNMAGSTLAIYSPGQVAPGASFGALNYTVSAGSAVLTTW